MTEDKRAPVILSEYDTQPMGRFPHVPAGDDSLQALRGVCVSSLDHPGVRYRFGKPLGEGGMAIAFLVVRETPSGSAPVVIKVIRPKMALGSPEAVQLMLRKECVALGRLNERVPVSPFVIRLVETSTLNVVYGDEVVSLPWIAVEYVDGGAEGTTLQQRVEFSLGHLRHAFGAARTSHALRCIAHGLHAIHEVGVTHRDLTPSNVLCSGFGEDEIFKIVDFGIARPAGLRGTFSGKIVGTAGYAAPEQLIAGEGVGPASDIFSFAAIIFYMLTGEDYFQVVGPVAALAAAHAPERRSLLDAPRLAPELRSRPETCQLVDALLAEATQASPELRPRAPLRFARELLSVLDLGQSVLMPSARDLREAVAAQAQPTTDHWTWRIRHAGGDDRVVYSAAWDGTEHCLAVTVGGLEHWNGTAWAQAPAEAVPSEARFVQRVDAGEWLIGCEGGLFSLFSREGAGRTFKAREVGARYRRSSGDLDDLMVFLAESAAGSPSLHARVGSRWLRGLPVREATAVSGLARVSDEQWLLCGRTQANVGFVFVYFPLEWRFAPVRVPAARAYLAAAARPDLFIGLIGASAGIVVRTDQGRVTASRLPVEADVTAVAVDATGCAWAATRGALWTQSPGQPQWTRAWHDDAWTVPFVQLGADVGNVVAMAADGGIVQGTSVAGAR